MTYSDPGGAPAGRVLALNHRPVAANGEFVLYWMVANRRLEWNYALDRAIAHAEALGRPLLVLEAIRHGYQWAAPRHHRFCLDGMREHAARLAGSAVAYHPYVEPSPGAGAGLLETLAARACVVVTDDFPVFFLPRMQQKVADRLPVRLETVDSNGLLPMRSAGRDFTAAVHFRRHLQKTLPEHLVDWPSADPLTQARLVSAGDLPGAEVRARWPAVAPALLAGDAGALAALGLAGDVAVVPFDGGRNEALRRLDRFMEARLVRYGEDRNHPDRDASSRLSPFLHWGHLSVHEIFARLVEREGWSPARLSGAVTAKREGWWGMSPEAEAFLDELVTWREIGFNFAVAHDDYDRYETLPAWARATLAEHAADPRPELYTLDELAAAATSDPVWNAAQRELLREGTIHNYLRMLWGKRIVEWTRSPEEALEVMIELNNRYSVDGRDPNSYSGIFWVLGRFDRAWQERPVYGKVRYMSSEATKRKLHMDNYLRVNGPASGVGDPSR